MLAVQGVHGSEMLLVLKEPQKLTFTVACKLSWISMLVTPLSDIRLEFPVLVDHSQIFQLVSGILLHLHNHHWACVYSYRL